VVEFLLDELRAAHARIEDLESIIARVGFRIVEGGWTSHEAAS